MKIKRQKGFSLAEVLISLTVVSIMVAVAAPVFTKQSVGDNTWKWTQGDAVKNGASFDGNNLVIGNATVPVNNDIEDNDYFKSFKGGKSSYALHTNDELKVIPRDSLFRVNNRLVSKLSILKAEPKSLLGTISDGPFKDSHISFYNVINGQTEYAGRLAADAGQLALGIGAMQNADNADCSMFWSSSCYNYGKNRQDNLAIGHYTLSSFEGYNKGVGNVALGYGALANKEGGSDVTAVGYKAAFNSEANVASANTVIGNSIGTQIEEISGWRNLIIGNYDNSLPANMKTWETDNILIGHNAGRGIPEHYAVSDNNYSNLFAVGNVNPNATDETRVELLQGLTQAFGSGRKLVVNGDLVIRTGDGSRALFKVDGTGTVSSIARCEGAEVCSAKFNVPFADCGFLRPATTIVEAYDVYMNTSPVGIYHNSITPIQHLKAALLYLDKYKDSKGGIINFIDKQQEVFGIVFPGLSGVFGNFNNFLLSLIGLSSDERLKNIYGDSKVGLKEINALKIKDYTYKADKNKVPHVGVIAQELRDVFPNSVIEGEDGYLSVKQEEMFFGLVKSIQELSNKNDKMAEKLALFKEQAEYTKAQNELIKQENKLLKKQKKEYAKRIADLQKKDKK